MPERSVPDARHSEDNPVCLATVDIRTSLGARPHRAPEYDAEIRALETLALELSANPQNLLQKLTETALETFDAETAGVSILETHEGAEVFRWVALAGVLAGLRNHTMPRDAIPCGICLDENATQLMLLPDRHFPAVRIEPRIVELLMVPFALQGRPVGTVWLISHRPDRNFDREDERLLRTLTAFASAGWQMWRSASALAEVCSLLKEEVDESRRVEGELRRAQMNLANVTSMMVHEQETERRLLARELHDNFSQTLAALSMEASALAQRGEPAETMEGRIRDLSQKLGDMANAVHSMSYQLHPAILEDLGLEAAVRDECANFSQFLGIPIWFKADRVPRSLPGDVALYLFRLVQESLRNIGKHASAKEVSVSLVCRRSDLALFVEDTGTGFDIAEARGKGAMGLIGMEERVRAVHGDFKIRSEPGMGTKIEVHVPLPEDLAR